jgi:hypothetical protein
MGLAAIKKEADTVSLAAAARGGDMGRATAGPQAGTERDQDAAGALRPDMSAAVWAPYDCWPRPGTKPKVDGGTVVVKHGAGRCEVC